MRHAAPDHDGVVLVPVEHEAGGGGAEQRVAARAAAHQVEAGVQEEGGEGAGHHARQVDQAHGCNMQGGSSGNMDTSTMWRRPVSDV